MNKTAVAVPMATLLGAAALAAGPAVSPASAAPAITTKAPHANYVKRYHLKKRELRQIKKAARWARTPKSRSVLRCESNFDYQLVDGPYHGAWQFLTSTWLGAGGGRYAHNADKAPRFAQNHIAWKLWKRSGWGPWSCA